MDVSIIISSYGTDWWRILASERALPSAQAQGAHEVVVVHQPGGTVSSARNVGAEQSSGNWLCFLDADDELSPDFIGAMRRAHDASPKDGVAPILFTPSVSYVHHRRQEAPKIWPRVPFESGNWLVIGTLLPRDLFFSVGMFRDYGDPPGSNAYEDWSLWARCYQAGAEVVEVPEAIYVAHWERQSRHRGADHRTRLGWHYEIGRDLFPDRYPEDWMNMNMRPQRRQRVR